MTFPASPRAYLARLRSDGTRPTFAAPTSLATGDLGMKLLGNAQATYVLESSGDLLTWLPVWTNTFTGTSWEWSEPNAAMTGPRFYRVHQFEP